MPNYISVEDIYNYEIYELSTTVIGSTTVSSFIDDAEAEINAALTKRYTVPFTSTTIPPLIKKIDRDIAGYYILDYLHSKKNRNQNFWVIEKGKEARKLLSDLAEDKLRLISSLTTGGVGEVALKNISQKATYTTMPTIVNMDDFMNWKVPTTLITDITNNRNAV